MIRVADCASLPAKKRAEAKPARPPDGDRAENVAGLLYALERDDAAYQAMLAWKTKGYSDDFKALIHLTDVTSSCRACVSIADERRHQFGSNAYDERVLREVQVEARAAAAPFSLFVRERGDYVFHRLEFARVPTMLGLVRAVLTHLSPREKQLWKENDDLRGLPARVYAFYTVTQRLPVLGNEDLAALPAGAEVKVIFV
jgi:hypothetical protein